MAINFPDPSQQTTYVADSGVTYEFIDGVWKATTFAGLGDVRYVNSTGDDMSGNLTIATDKISLNTDGSAEFAGDVKGLMFDTDPAGGGVRSLRSIGGLVQVWRGGLATDNITSEIFADGSAAFSGTITSGGPGIVGGTDLGSFIGYEGNAGFSCGATSSAIRVWTQGNSTPTVDIQGNGSASFANTVTSGSTTRRGQFLGTCPSSVVAASADAFAASYDGDIVVSIKYDGSATFAGTVDANALTVDGAAVDTSAQVDAKIAAIPPTDLSAYDTSAEVTAKVAALETSLTDGAPGALDTLNELAASLGDDSNFAGTVTNSLAGKADLSGATFTGDVTASAFIGDGSQLTGVGSETIISSTPPTPSDYEVGTMWWNSDSTDTALYILYQDPAGPNGDAGGKYWVEAAPAPDSIGFDGTHTGDSTFTGNMNVTGTVDAGLVNVDRVNVVNTTETGSDIVHTINTGSSLVTTQRSKADGSLQIGSIDGNSDTANIELNADGSATFADYVTSNEGFYVAQTAAPNGSSIFKSWLGSSTYVDILDNGTASFAGVVVADTGFQSNAYSGRSVGITTTTQGVERALAVEDGSGGYSASLNMDGSATFGNTSGGSTGTGGLQFSSSNGQLDLINTNSGSFITAYNRNSTSQVFSVGASGSATFASQVSTSDRFDSNRTTGTDNVFNGRLNNSVTSKILADGSAEFNSYVNVGSNELAGDFNTYINAPIGDDYFIASKAPGSLSTSPILFGVKTDGSATFAGTIKSTTWPTTGYEIESSGALGLNAAAGTSGNMFALNVGGTQVTSITGQGIATFASEVVAGVRDSQGVFMTSGGGLEGFNGGSRKYSLSSDGSATFGTSTDYVKIDPVTNGLFIVNNGVSAINLDKDGSAVFTGTINGTTVGTSDIKFKENIEAAPAQLADIEAFELKTFDWKDEAPMSDELKSQRKIGLIAQEVEAICPEMVCEVAGQDEDSYKAINHDVLIMKLLGAVKELAAEVAALKAS